MVIKISETLFHWNYFLALESDLERVSRYIEFVKSNFKTYSIELAHLLLAASSEVDVVAKALCQAIDSKAKLENIDQYKKTIRKQLPELITEKVLVPRYGLTLQPWSLWKGEKNPGWWRSYNKVKHERSNHFDEANLKNVLNAMAKPKFLETLAAAYTETGDYDSAIDWQKKAINMLPKDEYSIHHESMHSKLRLYQSYKPNRIVIDKPMVAWWKLDDFDGSIAVDSSGNNLHGRLHGNPQWDDGRVCGALVFDDEDDYIDCGVSSLFDLTEAITVACWIKIQYFSHAHQTIIAKGKRSWRLQRFQYGERIEFGCTGVDVETNTWGNVIGKTRISDGLWHHVVGVYDGNRLCLYVDGKLDNFEFASGRIDLNDDSVAISHNAGESSKRHWNGLIDDVRIYSYALTEDEIKALYDGKESVTTD